MALATIALPYTPLAAPFGFVPLPLEFLGILALIVLGYVITAEVVKRWFYASTFSSSAKFTDQRPTVVLSSQPPVKPA